jgi:hypothetical protein
MPEPERSDRENPVRAEERGAALALLPIAATLDYYALPGWLQEQALVQLAPQLIAYLACGLWAAHNSDVPCRLGLARKTLGKGVATGFLTGMLLGAINSSVILWWYPHAGYDIEFLRQTPHAQVPVLAMIPWVIFGIAIFVEVNFRGFLLGRLLALGKMIFGRRRGLSSVLAVSMSALVFAFDPFMVVTFQHLHWIALWDGLVWGTIRLCTGNVSATILAHAIEVVVMYSAVRHALLS